jgi:hypothetical protein
MAPLVRELAFVAAFSAVLHRPQCETVPHDKGSRIGVSRSIITPFYHRELPESDRQV